MLGRPFGFGLSAIVISPDDLVDETLAPEDPVQPDLAIMHLAVVDVEIQAAAWFQQPVSLFQARAYKFLVIIKGIGVLFGAQLNRLVSIPLETLPIAVLIADGLDLGASLDFAGIKRRVDVN